MIRRTSWRHYHRNHMQVAEQVAIWMAELRNWEENEMRSELAAYQAQSRSGLDGN
jgi:hypothetical protein